MDVDKNPWPRAGSIRRTAILLAALAAAFYLGFMLLVTFK